MRPMRLSNIKFSSYSFRHNVISSKIHLSFLLLIVNELCLWDETYEFFDYLSGWLTRLSRKSMPLVQIDLLWFWNAFVPDDGCVDEGTSHIQDIVEEVLIKHYWLEAVVPKVNIDIVDGHIDLALVTPHEVELVNDGYFQHPVLPWITLDHSSKLINLGYEAWAEAVWV